MKAPAKVVMKSVGSRISNAMPTQNAVNRRAPSTPMSSAATRANTKTVMVITTKSARGMPERATWDSMKACQVLITWSAHNASIEAGMEVRNRRRLQQASVFPWQTERTWPKAPLVFRAGRNDPASSALDSRHLWRCLEGLPPCCRQLQPWCLRVRWTERKGGLEAVTRNRDPINIPVGLEL